jgi:FixJ family two-component response regulator
MTTNRPMIAVVDDDESVRRAMCRLLRTAGFNSRGFASGREFLEAWLTDPPDCLILDLQMPEMSGMEVQRKLCETGMAPATIFITAHNRGETREQCLRAGAAAYLRKPLERRALLEAVGEALRGARGPCSS